MAVKARYTKLWVDEFEFSGVSTSAQMTTTAETIDTTAFQDDGRESILAISEMTITHSGHYTAHDTDSMEAQLNEKVSTSDSVVALGLGTNNAGYPCKVLPAAIAQSFEMGFPVDGLMTIDGATWQTSTGWQAGLNVFDSTFSATGEQSSVDFASAGSNGGKAYVIVTGISGSATNATIDIESSSDDASFASEGTATFSAVGAVEVSMSGTVNRYIRANCTSLGGATSITCAIIVCVAGVNRP